MNIDQAQTMRDNELPEEPICEWCHCGKSYGAIEEDEEEYTCEDCQEQEWERNFRIRNSK